MNVVDVRSNLRRLSVPRRNAERADSSDRRQGERRQQVVGESDVADSMFDALEDDTQKKYVRVSLTPGERTLLQDMYLIENE